MGEYEGEKVVFVLTAADVRCCAQQMGYPEEVVTDDVVEMVRNGMNWGLECWAEVMMDALNFALKSGEGERVN